MIWAKTADGVRLRAAQWGRAPYALVLTGRSEHLEKYAPVAGLLAERGYGMIACDWRGQGLSDRLVPGNVGYVGSFADYQLDLDAAIAALAVSLGEMPLMVAHSMGCLIGLRYLARTDHVSRAIMTGPMVGTRRQTAFDPLLQLVLRAAARLGFGARRLPGTTLGPTVIASPFEGNVLTRSRARWDVFYAQLTAHPGLGVGGATIRWAAMAVEETARLRRWPVPDIPILVLTGASEDVVSRPDIDAFVARAPQARQVVVPAAEHELLMEGPNTEALVWAEIDRFLAQRRAAP